MRPHSNTFFPTLSAPRTLAMAACLAGAALLSGCRGTLAPTLQVVSITIPDETPDALVIYIAVEADNPNRDPLPLRDVTYTVFLDGREVFSGTRSAEATIRRFGKQVFVLPAVVQIPQDQRSADLASLRIAGSVVFRKPSAFDQTLYEQGLARPRAHFSHEAGLDLLNRP
jgi:hypothetical protein